MVVELMGEKFFEDVLNSIPTNNFLYRMIKGTLYLQNQPNNEYDRTQLCNRPEELTDFCNR